MPGTTDRRRLGLLVIRAAAAAAAVLVLGLAAVPARAADQSPDYVVGPQDVLAITVWDQADLSGKFTVEADGSFTFPLIGRVHAGGLTLRAVEAEMVKKLADGYFKNPQVTVMVDTYRSQRVFIVGEVRVPGTYTLTGSMSLIEALSRAGSTTPAASSEVIIVHAPEGKGASGPVLPEQSSPSQTVHVDLNDLQRGGAAENITLRDGDTVFVPRAATIYVFGQVKNPGAYALQTKETTVMQALALAGGVTDRGAAGRVKIVRIVNGAKKEIKVKLTDLVQPDDTLVVPERFF